MLFSPLGEGVKVVAGADGAVARIFVLWTLVYQSAISMTENLLADHVDAVHRVVVGRIGDGEGRVKMQFDDERSHLSLCMVSVRFVPLCEAGLAYQAMKLMEAGHEVNTLGCIVKSPCRRNKIQIMNLTIIQGYNSITL